MSFLKIHVGVRAALMALTLLVAGAQAARAETALLVCSSQSGPMKFTVDFDRKSVGNRGYKAPANITDETIKFDIPWDDEGSHLLATIDRITGAFEAIPCSSRKCGAPYRGTCHKGEKQF